MIISLFRGRTADQLAVRIGSSNRAKGGDVLSVYKVHEHKSYNPKAHNYDFAILELATAITFDETKQPINLPEPDALVEDGTLLDVSGWGDTKNENEPRNILRQTIVPKINQKECNDAYWFLYDVTDQMMCAGYKEGQKDACHGDSGGPLSVNNTLFGVVSWGFGCALPGLPGVYSRITAVVDWVNEIIQQ